MKLTSSVFAVIPAIAVLHNIARQCHDPDVGEVLGEDNDDDDDEDHVRGRRIMVVVFWCGTE